MNGRDRIEGERMGERHRRYNPCVFVDYVWHSQKKVVPLHQIPQYKYIITR